ncbi:ATP-dependent helicase [Diaphorobacter sp. HDW4A]|uniref:UvrD-helicase domain-containing protein n=1 Tax=Diaphorobacter sp. HDW4A TaxID=2714924 RepID=UPI0014096E49|nr:UvrD-helicase domain-containing protein [Diaphorobacter sp. HDW4A]QIL80935.1 ATP-dependent helicase [Diaphorobacter sp. HDW4A]
MSTTIELSESRKALLATTGNTIVLGGPGSGKTTIALLKANQEIRSGVLKPGQRILFLSFARATVARVAQHAESLISKKDFSSLEINTYHGFTWNLLRSHGYLMRDGRTINLLPPPEAAARLSTFKTPDDRLNEKRRLFVEEGLLHFDLFAEKAATLLTRSHSLRQIICDTYPIMILDEFQDTNQDEWSLIRSIGQWSRVLALADAEQRIYEFRGADPKRISEFIADFQPSTFDFGSENHRSNGTDIGTFGNDLLTQANIGKKYSNVVIESYGFYRGRSHLFPLKVAVLKSLQRLIKNGGSEWSIAILVPTKQLMLQASDYLTADTDGLPSLNHDVALDTEAPSLAAVLIASLLEGGPTPAAIAQRLIRDLCVHIRGRKGAKLPNQAELDLVDALDGYLNSGTIKGPKKKRTVEAIQAVAQARFDFRLFGDPGVDWLAVRDLLDSSGIDVLQQVATDAKYLRLLHKGAALRSRLNELWRSAGTYTGAEVAVRDALVQEHFSASLKDWKGIHVMTIHKSKGKEFSEVIVYEGSHQGRILRGNATEREGAQALLALRVAVTRAMKRATILTPSNDRCPFL